MMFERYACLYVLYVNAAAARAFFLCTKISSIRLKMTLLICDRSFLHFIYTPHVRICIIISYREVFKVDKPRNITAVTAAAAV